MLNTFKTDNDEQISPKLLTRLTKIVFRNFESSILPLWVSGLFLLEFFVQKPWLDLENLWPQYILLGTLFPLTVFGLSFIDRIWLKITLFTKVIKLVLSILCCYELIAFSLSFNAHLTLALAIISWFIVLLVQRYYQPVKSLNNLVYIAVGMVVSATAWIICIRLVIKGDYYLVGAETWFEDILLTYKVLGLALIPIFALVFLNLFVNEKFLIKSFSTLGWSNYRAAFYSVNPASKLKTLVYSNWKVIGRVSALVLFLAGSFRCPPLEPLATHHWSALTAPASMVRQGGVLLWDTPEQYGFLNTLIVAYLPTDNVYQSFYILNTILLTTTAFFIFSLLRQLKPGFLNYIFSLAVAFAAVFLVPGSAGVVNGILFTPSVTSYRFIFNYLIIAVVLWEGRQSNLNSPDVYRRVFWVGSLCWLGGVVWSAESAIYATAVWVPAYVLMVAQRAYFLKSTLGKKIGFCLRWFLLLPALVITIVIFISVVYLTAFGHLPDWSLFFQYATVFQGGFGRTILALNGTVWLLIFTLMLVTTAGAYWLNRDGIFSTSLRGCLAAFGMIWATASYFVGRSVDITAINLTPLMTTAVAILLYLLARDQQPIAAGQVWLKLAILPFFVVMLYAPVSTIVIHQEQVFHLVAFYEPNVAPKVSLDTDPELTQLMLTANVLPTDPIVIVGDRFTIKQPSLISGNDSYLATPKMWIPVSPNSLLSPLSDDKVKVYIDRFVDRVQSGGWLIEPISDKTKSPGIYYGIGFPSTLREPELAQTRFKPTRVFQSQNWKITWYDLLTKP